MVISANISEIQREICLVNISKVYELVKITQNEKNNSKRSEMQAAGGPFHAQRKKLKN